MSCALPSQYSLLDDPCMVLEGRFHHLKLYVLQVFDLRCSQ